MNLDHDLAAFSPAKELKRSGSEVATWDPDIESSGSEAFQPSADTYEDSPHHFRGSSFGEELENPYTSTTSQREFQVETREIAWQERYKTAGFELERASQRNQELIELLAAKEAEVARLREDLESLRLEGKDYMQSEIRTRELITRLETELVRGTQRLLKTMEEAEIGLKVLILVGKREKLA
jgi:predicted RNase H-like nuclease (RuvC/YqgF family)